MTIPLGARSEYEFAHLDGQLTLKFDSTEVFSYQDVLPPVLGTYAGYRLGGQVDTAIRLEDILIELPEAVVPQVKVTSVSPQYSYDGVPITVTGQNFGTAPGTITLWENSNKTGNSRVFSSFTSWTDTQIVFTMSLGGTIKRGALFLEVMRA